MPNPSILTWNLDSHLKKVVIFSTELPVVWTSGRFALKERFQNMIFPEGITYDMKKDEFRTGRVNYVFREITYQSNRYNKGTNTKGDQKSPLIHIAERADYLP